MKSFNRQKSFPTYWTLLSSRSAIAIYRTYSNCIPWCHLSKLSTLGSTVVPRTLLDSFPFYSLLRRNFHSVFSLEFLQSGMNAWGKASPTNISLTSSDREWTLFHPTYSHNMKQAFPPMKHLLPFYRPLKHPYCVNLYPEWYLSIVLSVQ